jgi:chemotaxis protein MotC
LIGFFLAFTLNAEASDAAELYEMVRDLNAAQNSMALGDPQASALSTKIMGEINRRVPEFQPNVWQNPKNNRAAAVYLLSGGSVSALRRRFDEKSFAPESSALIEASLAYAEGRVSDASTLLNKIDLAPYPHTLQGHILLVKGGLLVGVDNSRAAWMLDHARLLMPRSLVEEAAIRREIGIVDPSRHADKLLMLCERYSESYRASPFAMQFWAEFAAIAANATAQFYRERGSTLDSIVRRAPSAVQTNLNFIILRNSVLNGNTTLAASELRKAKSVPGNPEQSRIKLYSALVDVLSGRIDEGVIAARAIDQSTLTKEDIEARDIFLGFVASSSPPVEEREKRKNFNMEIDSEADLAILREGENALNSSGYTLEKAARQ